VSNVAHALEAGMAEAERVGELHSVMMIPRPLDDLERAMPLAECWLQELQPIRMPMNLDNVVVDRELQPLEMPEVVPVEIPAAAEVPQPMEQVAQMDLAYEAVPVDVVDEANVEAKPLEE
jgi:carbon dioxide concentrating mechanism protein CcmO